MLWFLPSKRRDCRPTARQLCLPKLENLHNMKGFIELYEDSDKANVLVSIANIIKVVPRKEGAYLHLAVQNARSLPYVVSTSSSYDEVKAKIQAAQ
jgi:hypothetical protein